MKKEKGISMIALILIIMALLITTAVITIVCVSASQKENQENEKEIITEVKEEKQEETLVKNNTIDKEEKIEATYSYPMYDQTINGKLIENMTLEYNGNTVSFPFTVKDLINIGFQYENLEQANELVKANSYADSGSVKLLTADKNGKLESISVWNASDTDKKYEDCYVCFITSYSDQITMNGITPRINNYNDVLSKFGRDVESRPDTYQADFADNSSSANGVTMDNDNSREKGFMEYYATKFKLKYEKKVGNTEAYNISFGTSVNKENGIVKMVTMAWYRF